MADLSSLTADRLNEIRERYEHAKVLIARDELRSVDMPSWSDVRDLLAALDAAEQQAAMLQEAYDNCDARAVQAEQERDEALKEAEGFRAWQGQEAERAVAAEARATKLERELAALGYHAATPDVADVAAEEKA